MEIIEIENLDDDKEQEMIDEAPAVSNEVKKEITSEKHSQ